MNEKKITVGLASCGISAGGDEVYDAFTQLIEDNPGINVHLGKTGCIGSCFMEVLVDVAEGSDIYTYYHVTPGRAREIFQSHILNNSVFEEYLVKSSSFNKEENFFKKQHRIVLRNAGVIDPENIEHYLEKNGYEGLEKALTKMTPEEVRTIVKKSGLKGRGGAGFLTGVKWEFASGEKGKKYVVCNADEGDPGAFMDRSVLEGDPHSVLEGLAIAAYAIGADEGYVYVRAEYPLAIERLNRAIEDAENRNFLGSNIFGSGFNFSLELKIGAGAFVCGEETALIASVEGKRGMPRKRPPYPAQKGIWNKPTIINNVETLASVAYIILNGWEDFASIGTENSKGTKVFALTGKIKKSGLVEVPMGISLREIIFDIGGGLKGDKNFKAVQLGGPSGGCLPRDLIDTAVDYESLKASGAIMGSGGMVVMDEDTCMVDVAKFFMNFIRDESCGKCTFCRIGTKRLHEILMRITSGHGVENDINKLKDLCVKVKEGSLCGLGQTAANPVLTTLKYFEEEYLEHIHMKKCRARVCKELLTYTIAAENCTGCTLCAKNCPVDAIIGKKKEAHEIEQDKCIKCGNCLTACNFNAVNVE